MGCVDRAVSPIGNTRLFVAGLGATSLLLVAACGSDKKAASAPLGQLDVKDAGTSGGGDGGAATGDSSGGDGGSSSGTGSPVLSALKADGVYLYGFLRETNDDWQALAALDKPGQAWVGLPFIVKDYILLGLRSIDGLPVYLEKDTVRAAQPDDWSFAEGVPDDVAENDERLVEGCEEIGDGRVLGRLNLPSAFRGAQLVAGSDEILALCCNDGTCAWRWGSETVSLSSELQVLAASDAGYALVADGNFEGDAKPTQLSIWNRATGDLVAVSGVEPDYTVRALDDRFLMLTGPISGFSRWHIGFDGQAEKDGDYPALPGMGERSCQFTPTGSLICIAHSGPGDNIYSFEIGEAKPTLLREEPNSASTEITLPYVKMTSYSLLVSGTGPSMSQ